MTLLAASSGEPSFYELDAVNALAGFNNDQYRELIQLVLPKEIFDYFNLLKLEVKGQEIHTYLDQEIHTYLDQEIHTCLDEENIVPEGYSGRL